MKLPEYFSFNQQNLQDYADCPRRFFLRHILKQEWPAIESDPVLEQETLILLGNRFHQMVQQFFAGVPQENIEACITDVDLKDWWHRFILLDIGSSIGTKYSEMQFSIPFEGFRLTAKYDLLVYQPNQMVVIYDWKTSQHSPKRNWLGSRMQTRVYPLVISSIAAQANSTFALIPDQIEMIYWYPAFPENQVKYSYSQEKFTEDQHYFKTMIKEILQLDEPGFTKTENETFCKYCRYRSLCNRGVSAGNRDEIEESETSLDSAFDLDFDQISPTD